MTVRVHIGNGQGTNTDARVTSIGELVTSDYSYWDTAYQLMDATATAYNFFKPRAGEQFVITGIILRANKLVSAVSDATVDIYEADSTTSTTIDKTLFKTQIVESQIMSVLPMRLLVNQGKYINGKTDDDDISVNMFGYYIPVR